MYLIMDTILFLFLIDSGIEYEIMNNCGQNIGTAGNSNFTQLEVFLLYQVSYLS